MIQKSYFTRQPMFFNGAASNVFNDPLMADLAAMLRGEEVQIEVHGKGIPEVYAAVVSEPAKRTSFAMFEIVLFPHLNVHAERLDAFAARCQTSDRIYAGRLTRLPSQPEYRTQGYIITCRDDIDLRGTAEQLLDELFLHEQNFWVLVDQIVSGVMVN